MQDMMMAGVASAEGLAVRSIGVPTPGKGEVLVRVHAAAMNRADLNAARGAGVASASSHGKAIGMEWSGEIVAIGDDVTGLTVGEPVACSGTGGYAEYALAAAVRCIPLGAAPMGLDQAAILPSALMTAHNALVGVGGMKKGDNVLIHGAGSGVGLAALQIAKHLGAAAIGATARRAATGARLGAFGATQVLDASADWVSAWIAATDGTGADVIVDMVTGAEFNTTLKAAALLGRVVNVGRLGGLHAEIDLDYHALKRLSLIGVTFRSRSLEEVGHIVEGVRRDLWPAVEAGTIALPIDREFALADAVAAHAHMAGDQHFGKIIIRP